MTEFTKSGTTPIYLLAGFLGSGKTTLLARMLERLRSQGLRPAVIMNELGDINLDGQLLDGDVPMAELLGGCICCSSRGDLGLEINDLMEKERPDVIIIESTGAANPLETIDGITEASMYKTVELRSIITVVDGPQLLERGRTSGGKTFKLLKEGIRCATLLLLNKADKLAPEELVEAQQLLREWNAHAPVVPTVRCELDDWGLVETTYTDRSELDKLAAESAELAEDGRWTEGVDVAGAKAGSPFKLVAPGVDGSGKRHSHDHVMAVTHYLRGAVDSEAFEALLRRLPDNIYRAKGIVTFTDTSKGTRYLFQYAYKETDYMRIQPQGNVHDVAVFIGEHFSREWLLRELEELEAKS